MEVIVNMNNDEIRIINEGGPDVKLRKNRLRSNYEIMKLLEEIFNRLDESRLSSASPYFGIKLTKIDEDTTTTIGEW